MVHIIFILLEIGLVYFWVSTKEDVDETIRVVIMFAIEYYVIYDRLKNWIETRKARNAYKGSIYEVPKRGKLADCSKMGELIAAILLREQSMTKNVYESSIYRRIIRNIDLR